MRFLAAGFEMAAEAGVPAILRSKPKDQGETGYSAPRRHTARYEHETVRVGDFNFDLPMAFLLDSIGASENLLVLSGAEAKGGARFGGDPRDGRSEYYRLASLELVYHEDAGERFHLCANMELGARVESKFVSGAPKDMSGFIHQAVLTVEFRDIFQFLFPLTRREAEALRTKLNDKFGIQLEMPAFHVSDKNG